MSATPVFERHISIEESHSRFHKGDGTMICFRHWRFHVHDEYGNLAIFERAWTYQELIAKLALIDWGQLPDSFTDRQTEDESAEFMRDHVGPATWLDAWQKQLPGGD